MKVKELLESPSHFLEDDDWVYVIDKLKSIDIDAKKDGNNIKVPKSDIQDAKKKLRLIGYKINIISE